LLQQDPEEAVKAAVESRNRFLIDDEITTLYFDGKEFLANDALSECLTAD
jgi:hypothetical protein